MDETTKLTVERFAKLPKNVQQAIRAVDLRPRLQKIAQKHRLHVDQAGMLENETVFVMLGLDSPDEFAGNLARKANIPPAQAQLIMGDVNEQIFLPIRESLRQLLEKEVAEEEQQEAGSRNKEVGIRNKELELEEQGRKPVAATPQAALPPKRDELLKEIETISVPREPEVRSTNNELRRGEKGAVPMNLPTGNIAETKLADMFNLPRENMALNQEAGIRNKESGKYNVDPYREPTDKSN